MNVTATKIKRNFGKYLLLAQTEVVIITKHSKEVGRLIRKSSYEKPSFLKLKGIIPKKWMKKLCCKKGPNHYEGDIETNVLIDFLSNRKGSIEAKTILLVSYSGLINGCVSAKMVLD